MEDIIESIEEDSSDDRILFCLVQLFDLIIILNTIDRITITADISLIFDADADTNADSNYKDYFLLNNASIVTWFFSNLSLYTFILCSYSNSFSSSIKRSNLVLTESDIDNICFYLLSFF